MADKEWTGSFTAEEFLSRAKDNDKAAQIGLAAGPNIKYVRTHQCCAAALRIAAATMSPATAPQLLEFHEHVEEEIRKVFL